MGVTINWSCQPEAAQRLRKMLLDMGCIEAKDEAEMERLEKEGHLAFVDRSRDASSPVRGAQRLARGYALELGDSDAPVGRKDRSCGC
ncbi:MAG: hypothetical protein Q7T01_04170 [bacterium]|nr:hypothetical protein [bacterium]